MKFSSNRVLVSHRLFDELERMLDIITIHAGEEENCDHTVKHLIEEIFSNREKEAGLTRPDHDIQGGHDTIEGSDSSKDKQKEFRSNPN